MCAPVGWAASSGTESDAHCTVPHGVHVIEPVRSTRSVTVADPPHPPATIAVTKATATKRARTAGRCTKPP